MAAARDIAEPICRRCQWPRCRDGRLRGIDLFRRRGPHVLWVDPSARGQGVGDRLVAAVVEWAKESGFVQVLLAVKVGNSRAETLYARNGFIRLETSTRGDEFEMSLRL